MAVHVSRVQCGWTWLDSGGFCWIRVEYAVLGWIMADYVSECVEEQKLECIKRVWEWIYIYLKCKYIYI